eukprot:scaffold5413_cov117-Isochrysis_galbana.AAC.5
MPTTSQPHPFSFFLAYDKHTTTNTPSATLPGPGTVLPRCPACPLPPHASRPSALAGESIQCRPPSRANHMWVFLNRPRPRPAARPPARIPAWSICLALYVLCVRVCAIQQHRHLTHSVSARHIPHTTCERRAEHAEKRECAEAERRERGVRGGGPPPVPRQPPPSSPPNSAAPSRAWRLGGGHHRP